MKPISVCSMMIIITILCCGCETSKHELHCDYIKDFSPYQSTFEKYGINITYQSITTRERHNDNELLCYADMSFKNKFGLSNNIRNIPLNYRLYMADDRKTYSIDIIDNTQKVLEIAEALNHYNSILNKSITIESYINGDYIYIYHEPNSSIKYLKINDQIVESVSNNSSSNDYGIKVSKQFDINNKPAFIYKIFHTNNEQIIQNNYLDVKTNIVVIESNGKYSLPYKAQNSDSVNTSLLLQANQIKNGVQIMQIMEHDDGDATGYDTFFEYAK